MQITESIIRKVILTTVILFLTSCRTVNISTACPEVPFYAKEEQKELDRIRTEVKEQKIKENKESDSIILDKFLIDYGNLREDLKLCNGIDN